MEIVFLKTGMKPTALLILGATAVLLHDTRVCGETAERKVAAATRLDWEFAVSGFGKGAAKLPAGYDSAKQRYQLFVPKSYRKDKSAALVLFISPGDQPGSFKSW